MPAKEFLKKIYNLIIVNTLDSVMKIDTLIEGIIVSTFGVMFGFFGWVFFHYAAWEFSAAVAKLSLFAYLAVLMYHVAKFQKDRHKKQNISMMRYWHGVWFLFFSIITLLLYFPVINQALYVAELFKAGNLLFGPGILFLKSLPGLLVLMIPLFGWEKLCAVTPVDEIERIVFK